MRGCVWLVASTVMGVFLLFNALVVSRGIRSSRLVRGPGNLRGASAAAPPRQLEEEGLQPARSERDQRLAEAVAASEGGEDDGGRVAPPGGTRGGTLARTGIGKPEGAGGPEAAVKHQHPAGSAPKLGGPMEGKGGEAGAEGGVGPPRAAPRVDPPRAIPNPRVAGAPLPLPTLPPARGGGGGQPGAPGGAFARLGAGDMYGVRALPGQSMGEVKPRRAPRPTPSATGAAARNDGNLQFVHIPKNAGSAITQSGRERGVLWAAANVGRRRVETVTTRNGTCTCPWWHHPPWSLDPELLASKGLRAPRGGWSPIFCVVRDPRERLGSVLAQHLQVFIKQTGGDVPQKAEQIATLRGIFDRELPKDPCFAGCHFVPQHEFVFAPDGSRVCSRVLRFESLGRDFARLMGEFNMSEVTLPDGVNEQHFRKIQWRDLPLDLRKKVAGYYKGDFDLFYPGELERPYGQKR